MQKTRLAPMSAGFDIWLNPPVKTVRAYRLFDITNHLDVMTTSGNPTVELKETDPFTYQYAR